MANNSTTASSRTEPPTSGSLASTASADRELSSSSHPVFYAPALFVLRAYNSDGPDPHVEGQKGGKASGGSSGEKYKPSEHGGLKKDGSPDPRTSSEHGFGGS